MTEAREALETRRKPTDARATVSDLVLTAAGLDDAERAEYLRSLATTRPEVAEEVRRRLEAAELLSDSFLEVPAADRLTLEGKIEGPACQAIETGPTGPDPGAAAPPPEERYDIGESLGRGGMGRVVRAFDRQLDRTVALKFLVHQDPEIQRLFLLEAKAQARVRHEHVLEIYDSGQLGDQPFIAMRCVEGQSLGAIAPDLTLELRVRLLMQAAEGLHAAHRAGLLHRDVKPANILVEVTADGDHKALVTDFGLAADLERADDAVAASIAGSPQYIAPERLRSSPGLPDRRSDVYSLGVTMYQVLTGRAPFIGADTVAILSQIGRRDVPGPRQVLPNLPRELDAIVRRAMAHDPDQRYGSAKAVAADLRRYLDGEVVEAYTAGLAYRLTRFVLRNKLLTALVATATGALLIASAAVTVFAVRADAARERAELRQGQAEELLRFMVVDLRERLDSLGRLDLLDTIGDTALDYFATVPETELSEAELLRRSRILYQLGEVRIRQGDLVGARQPMQQSLALAERLHRLAPDDDERLFELGQGHFWVGYVAWEEGDLISARGPFEEYLKISRRLVEWDPDNLDWQRELSYANSNLGSVLEAEGDYAGALARFRATLSIDRKLAAAEPNDAASQRELAATHNTLGKVLEAMGRLAEAGGHLRQDLRIRQALQAIQPDDHRNRERLGASHGHLGVHWLMQGELDAAENEFRIMHEIAASLVEHDPANTSWRYQLAWSHLNLGRVAFARGDFATASDAWSRQRELIRDLLALDATPHRWNRTLATGLLHLALLERDRSPTAAKETVLEALAVFDRLAKARPTDPQVHRWLTRGYLLLGQLEPDRSDAESAYREALRRIEPFARDSRDGRVVAPWAEVLRCLGREEIAARASAILSETGYAEPAAVWTCSTDEASASALRNVLSAP